MLQIALCDDNIDELSNMVQLIDLYRTSKNLNCEYSLYCLIQMEDSCL